MFGNQKVVFHFLWRIIYTCNSNFQKVTSMKQLPVDVKDLNEGLSSLLLPSQKVMFSPHMYVLPTFYYVFTLLGLIK